MNDWSPQCVPVSVPRREPLKFLEKSPALAQAWCGWRGGGARKGREEIRATFSACSAENPRQEMNFVETQIPSLTFSKVNNQFVSCLGSLSFQARWVLGRVGACWWRRKSGKQHHFTEGGDNEVGMLRQ